jgi:hypothetical protein
MKKDDPKKKKKLPFYGRAYGGAARRRADRKAYRRGGAVSKADGEPISPNEPNAPVGGKVLQTFKRGGVAKRQDGGATEKPKESPRPFDRANEPKGLGWEPPGGWKPPDKAVTGSSIDRPTLRRRSGGAVKKRAVGGTSDDDRPTVPRSSSVDDLTTAGLKPLLPALGAGDLTGGLGAGAAAAPPPPMAGTPSGPPGPVPAGGPGMRRGGAVKKRQDGGPTDAEREEGLDQLKKKMTSPLGGKIGRYQEAQSRNIVDSLRPRSFGGRAEPALRKSGGD